MAKKKYEVTTKNIPDFTGIDAGNVAFANGKAVIEDERMASWFREHEGYEVKEVKEAKGQAPEVAPNEAQDADPEAAPEKQKQK